MASKSNYRFAASFDFLLIWFREGGKYAIILLVFSFFLRMFEQIPGWVPLLVLLLAAAVAGLAFIRLVPYQTLRARGEVIEGRVTEIERKERLSGTSDGSISVRKRMTYVYTYEGRDYTGRTGWRGVGIFGTFEAGHTIEICVDPRQPSRARWEKDIPLRMPQIIGM